MATCQNGRRALTRDECFKWVIPGSGRHFVMARAAAGFVMAHYLLWFHEVIEPLGEGLWDDWGYDNRFIRGSTSVITNHAGWAADHNATRHPLGIPATANFTPAEIRAIRNRLRWMRGVIRWGGDYAGRPDPMHIEIVGSVRQVLAVAVMLKFTPRGRRIRRANPGCGW
jgi:hypothetical protein